MIKCETPSVILTADRSLVIYTPASDLAPHGGVAALLPLGRELQSTPALPIPGNLTVLYKTKYLKNESCYERYIGINTARHKTKK